MRRQRVVRSVKETRRLAGVFVPAFAILAIVVPTLSAQSSAEIIPGACTVPDSISDALHRLVRRVGDDAGIAAIHLESGVQVSINGDRAFPMASVSKIPMALEFLRRVDAGDIRLDETIVVRPTDFRPGNSPMASWSGGRAVRLRVDSLFKLMLVRSDNSATDVVLRMAGGPEAVTGGVRELGIDDVTVHRSEARTFADLVGLSDTIPESELYRSKFFRLRDALPQAHRDSARLQYGHDPRDTATPEGMAALLTHIHHGAGLSRFSHDLLLDAMTASRSGPRRMRGRLPMGTEVAHKTGTMAGAINDVGIIELPTGEHLVLAVFVNTLRRSTGRREQTISATARLLYDYFSESEPAARSAETSWPQTTRIAASRCDADYGPAG